MDGFRARWPEVEECRKKHRPVLMAREMAMNFVVGADGRVQQAWLEPEEMAVTPFGKCVEAMAETIAFSPRAEAVQVSVRFTLEP